MGIKNQYLRILNGRNEIRNRGRIEMLDSIFHTITLDDKAWMDMKFAEEDKNACEYTFANNFMWRKTYQTEVAELCSCLVIRFRQTELYYSYPIGKGDKRAAIEILLSESRKAGRRLCFLPVLEEGRRELLRWFPGRFLIQGRRDIYDYIYDRDKLAVLPGRKLHSKRNHIARFKEDANWEYKEMTGSNREACREMSQLWLEMQSEKRNTAMEHEFSALQEAFRYMDELGLCGGILKKEGEIVAFAIGERLNSDTFVVHFEKAYPMLQGAYPMINQQFTLHAGTGFGYVNREEDAGEPGLRKAKLSYYPEFLLKKYSAAESPVVYADKYQDGTAVRELWEICFGDSGEDIDFYMEHCMTEENMLLIYAEGRLAAMGSFLEAEFLHGGKYREARYVYALATHPEYRGRGLARQLLEFAKENYHLPLILAPAEPSLISYYERAGFVKSTEETEYHFAREFRKEEEKPLDKELKEIEAEEYMVLRKQHYEREGFVNWDISMIDYAMECCRRHGGAALSLAGADNRKDILLYGLWEGTLHIVETTLEEEELPGVLSYLLEKTGASTAEYRRLSTMLWIPEQELPCPGALYLGLTLGN